MADAHKNFAYSTVATAPSPAASGTSLVVQSGDGAKFPTPPFNATVWPSGTQPLTTNAEIVRVTAISTDTLTITRTQESTSARTVLVGDQIAATITAKTLTDVEDHGLLSGLTDDDHTQYALLAGRSGGQSLTGGTGASENLTLASTSNSTKGAVTIDQQLKIRPSNVTFSANPSAGILMDADYILDFANAGFGAFASITSSIEASQTASTLAMGLLFNHAATWKNTAGEANNLGPLYTLIHQPNVEADTATITLSSVQPVRLTGRYRRTTAGSGGLTLTEHIGINMALVELSTGMTLTNLYGFKYTQPATMTGTLTNQYAIDIGTITNAATINIGIRNAAPTAFTGTSHAQITAVGNTITPTATYMKLTANGAYTLTSTPTIAAGQVDGQILILEYTSASNSVTLQRESALAGSTLRLASATRALSQYDTIMLMWDGTNSQWVELSFANNT